MTGKKQKMQNYQPLTQFSWNKTIFKNCNGYMFPINSRIIMSTNLQNNIIKKLNPVFPGLKIQETNWFL